MLLHEKEDEQFSDPINSGSHNPHHIPLFPLLQLPQQKYSIMGHLLRWRWTVKTQEENRTEQRWRKKRIGEERKEGVLFCLSTFYIYLEEPRFDGVFLVLVLTRENKRGCVDFPFCLFLVFKKAKTSSFGVRRLLYHWDCLSQTHNVALVLTRPNETKNK